MKSLKQKGQKGENCSKWLNERRIIEITFRRQLKMEKREGKLAWRKETKKKKTFKTERRQNNLTAHINLAHMLIHQRWRFRGPISRTKRSTSVGGLEGNRNSLRVIKGQQVHKIHFFKVIYYTENYTKPAEDSLICERIPRCQRSHKKKFILYFLPRTAEIPAWVWCV